MSSALQPLHSTGQEVVEVGQKVTGKPKYYTIHVSSSASDK